MGRGGGPFYGGGRPQSCNFCDAPDHFIRECPRVEEYVASQRCIRGDGGRVLLPSGGPLPSWTRGRTMQERFDHYYAASQNYNSEAPASQQPPSNNTVSQSLYEVSMYQSAEDFEIAEEEARLRELEVLATETRERLEKRKKVVFDGVDIPAKRGEQSGGRKVGPPGKNVTMEKGRGARNEAPPPAPVRPPPRAEANERDANQGPQFRYHSAAEDQTLVRAVMDRALGSKVEVSQRELLALAPELRRQMKDLTTTKRVPIQGAATHYNGVAVEDDVEAEIDVFANVSREKEEEEARREDDVIVAVDSSPLQTLEVLVDGKAMVEGVLDSGSQICSISKRIWSDKLGVGLRSDKIMIMEAANKTRTQTMGLLQNLKVKVADMELILQVQVMDDTPYDLLLGQPFFALASCVTRVYPNGEQYLTLHDPNSKREITVPTKQRVRRAEVSSEAQDFQRASRSR